MPKFEIVREPQVKFLLLLETSVQEEEWKWVNKAAQKLIRFDLPLNSNLGTLHKPRGQKWTKIGPEIE